MMSEAFQQLVAGAQRRPSVDQEAQELHAGAAVGQASPELHSYTRSKRKGRILMSTTTSRCLYESIPS